MNWLPVAWLLAAGEDKAPPPAQPPGADFMMFAPFVAIAIIFYFLLIRPQRRDQASKESMLAALKKNDKIVTIGGIIGSVANISPDGQEVTVKVDDNTRIKFVRSSIQRVVAPEGEGEKPPETK